MIDQIEEKRKRGLASCDSDVRHRVAQAGGNANHHVRGLQAVSPEMRTLIARKGGLSRGEHIKRSRTIKKQNELLDSENVIEVPQQMS